MSKRESKKRAKKSRRSGPKPWKTFELAVTAFLRTLLKDDPNAKVRFDPPKVDRDTQSKQQVDAWIDYKLGGHIPVTILVSCKDRSRRLDVGSIRTFIQEIQDSGASTGMIYARAGFTKDAIKKAAANGVGCFQLWSNQPADSPRIELYRRYWCWDSISVPVVEPGDSGFAPRNWEEFFELPVNGDGTEQTLGEYIEERLREGKDLAVKEKSPQVAFPEDVRCVVTLHDSAGEQTKITVECRWRKFQGKLSAAVLNGSYCVSTGQFVGTESAAWPLTFPPPESDWEELSENPSIPKGVKAVLFTKNSRLMGALRDHLLGKHDHDAQVSSTESTRLTMPFSVSSVAEVPPK